MKLHPPENDNYAATVVALKDIVPLEGCDNVVGTPIFGFQAIVGKDSKPGDLGIVFPAESQLSEEYARKNNLYRHQELNKDQSAKGYLEDNRRVKAMKFRGHRSDCLFMPLTSLSYVSGLDINDLEPGMTFDRLGDHEICQKYVVRRNRRESQLEKNKDKEFKRVDKKFLPEHYDSDHYYKNSDVIPPSKTIYVTQKLHGTSIRIGNTIVARRLNLADRLGQLLKARIQKTEYDYVFGSRRSIKDVNNPYQNHFYGADLWSEEGKKLVGSIPEGYILYGELIGWDPSGNALQKNYTYQVPEKTCDLYIYRVAHVNPQGIVCDLSWDQVQEFCRDRGLRTVPELWRGQHKDFVAEDYMDKRFREDGYINAVPLAKESPVDEGVCIRVDGIAPYILKAKGPEFYAHETKMLDEEALDIEAEESDG